MEEYNMSKTDPSDDIDRTRRARDDRTEPDEAPELYRCPIDGCSRTIIGNPGDLRNHVRQSEVPSHQHRTLTDDLEIELDEESYHSMWGPGVSNIGHKVPGLISNSAATVDW